MRFNLLMITQLESCFSFNLCLTVLPSRKFMVIDVLCVLRPVCLCKTDYCFFLLNVINSCILCRLAACEFTVFSGRLVHIMSHNRPIPFM